MIAATNVIHFPAMVQEAICGILWLRLRAGLVMGRNWGSFHGFLGRGSKFGFDFELRFSSAPVVVLRAGAEWAWNVDIWGKILAACAVPQVLHLCLTQNP